MKTSEELLIDLYEQSIKSRSILLDKNQTLMDKVCELTVDNNHLKRQNKIYNKLVLDKDNELAELKEEYKFALDVTKHLNAEAVKYKYMYDKAIKCYCQFT